MEVSSPTDKQRHKILSVLYIVGMSSCQPIFHNLRSAYLERPCELRSHFFPGPRQIGGYAAREPLSR